MAFQLFTTCVGGSASRQFMGRYSLRFFALGDPAPLLLVRSG